MGEGLHTPACPCQGAGARGEVGIPNLRDCVDDDFVPGFFLHQDSLTHDLAQQSLTGDLVLDSLTGDPAQPSLTHHDLALDSLTPDLSRGRPDACRVWGYLRDWTEDFLSGCSAPGEVPADRQVPRHSVRCSRRGVALVGPLGGWKERRQSRPSARCKKRDPWAEFSRYPAGRPRAAGGRREPLCPLLPQ
ncbi:hypothetical protein ACOMHN_032954 [Nucella lapillus]